MSQSPSLENLNRPNASAVRWWPRLNLYQVWMLFSIVIGVLALRSVENARQQLLSDQSSQVSINRELVVDNPTRVFGILAHPELSETRWRIYIPGRAIGQIVLNDQKVVSVKPGYHTLVIAHDRENFGAPLYNLFVDDVLYVKKFQWNPGQVALRDTTNVAVGERLLLGLDQIPSSQMQLWVETRREPTQ